MRWRDRCYPRYPRGTLKLGPEKDSDGDTLRYTIVTPPKRGAVRLLCRGDPRACGADNSAFTYVPYGNNTGGPDEFVFAADDSPGGGHREMDPPPGPR